MNLPLTDTHFKRFTDSDGRYQAEHRELALSHCKLFRTAIDAGAHVGYWSSELEEVFTTVHAFEPVLANVSCLRANTSRTDIYPIALGDGTRDSVRLRQVKEGNTGTWTIANKGAVSAPCLALDSFNFKHVDLIKIDVECHELEVLQGAIETIKKWQPVIVVELRDTATLKNAGFPGRGNLDEVTKFLTKLRLRHVGVTYADHVFAPEKS